MYIYIIFISFTERSNKYILLLINFTDKANQNLEFVFIRMTVGIYSII